MSRVKITLGIVVFLALVAVLYYGLSPLLRNIEVNDPMPGLSTLEDLNHVEATSVRPPDPVVHGPFPVVDTVAHPAKGVVKIVETDGGRYLRYEDYETINGPDLFVYLSTDLDATEFVNLGRIKGTSGNINYEIPADVDLSKFRYALTWCRAFRVLFNSAEIR